MKLEIPHTNLILVELPKDAVNFNSQASSIIYKQGKLWKYLEVHTECKIHGLITLPELTFEFPVDCDWIGIYTNDLYTKETSLVSLVQKTIQDAGYFLENPYKEKNGTSTGKPICIKGISSNLCDSINNGKCVCFKWQTAESKLIKGNLLLIEKIKE